MNVLRKGILTLLKSAVTGQAGALPEGFSLEEAMPVIRKHQLSTLAYEGARICGIPDTSPQMNQLFGIYCRQMLHSEAQMEMLERLYEAFEAEKIEYMPLKGSNMKKLYPKQELRLMGDADILIRTEQYDRIRAIVAELGFAEQVESDHEYIWQSKALCLELHKRLIPSYNPDFYAYFGDGWQLAKKQAGCRYAMDPQDDFVYQFVHFAKHYRDGGIGCRHVLDLWVYRRAFPKRNENDIRTELEKLSLLEFYDHCVRLLESWFDGGAEDDRTELMTDFIFDSGSWGKWENHVLSAELRNVKKAGSLRGGKIRSVVRAVFPSGKEIQARYSVLKKAPWLLPVIWPVRWADVLIFRRHRIRQKQRDLRSATAEKVENYQRILNYVGLDFRFEDQ